MKKKEIIKTVIFLLINLSLFVALIFRMDKKFPIEIESDKSFTLTKANIIAFIVQCICYGNGSFNIFGFYYYVGFKITKGKEFIYKNPHKEKKLENIDVGESITRGRYYKDYKISSSLFDWFYLIFILLNVVLFIVSFNMKYDWLIYISLISLVLMGIYGFLGYVSNFWVIYVKFFKWLGIFSFLEKDFNKTINLHNYFPISVVYYEQQKEIEKSNKK